MAALGTVYKGKITVLERRQMSFITREELERIVDQLRADRMQQHTEKSHAAQRYRRRH